MVIMIMLMTMFVKVMMQYDKYGGTSSYDDYSNYGSSGGDGDLCGDICGAVVVV
jgi:hypothetical protein